MKTRSHDPVDWSQFIPSETSTDGSIYEGHQPGLSKREYFAAKALQGLVSSYVYQRLADQCPDDAHLRVSTAAVLLADALIVKLNEESAK